MGAGVERAFGHALDALPPSVAERSADRRGERDRRGRRGEQGARARPAWTSESSSRRSEPASSARPTADPVPSSVAPSVAYYAMRFRIDARRIGRSRRAVIGGHAAERRAWHQAAGTAAPDEGIAAALVDVATAARARGGPAAAAAASERARASHRTSRNARGGSSGRRGPAQIRQRRTRPGPSHRSTRACRARARADLQLSARAGRGARRASGRRRGAARRRGGPGRPARCGRAAAMTMAAVQPFFASGQNATGLATAHRGWELAARAGPRPDARRAAAGHGPAAVRQPGPGPSIAATGSDLARDVCRSRSRSGAVLRGGTGIHVARRVRPRGSRPGHRNRPGPGVERTGPAALRPARAPPICTSGRVGGPPRRPPAPKPSSSPSRPANSTTRGTRCASLARVEAGQGHEDRCRAHLSAAGELIERCGTDVLRCPTSPRRAASSRSASAARSPSRRWRTWPSSSATSPARTPRSCSGSPTSSRPTYASADVSTLNACSRACPSGDKRRRSMGAVRDRTLPTG